MRRLPAWRSKPSPAPLSTLRCCETAGRLTGRSAASAPTEDGPSARRSKIARRVGSPRAVMESPSALVIAYRKLRLTQLPVKIPKPTDEFPVPHPSLRHERESDHRPLPLDR